MPRKYTDQQKIDALQHLADNYGNVTLTAIQTGIPERTLRDWKRRRKFETLKDLPPIKETRRRQQTAANDDPDQNTENESEGEYTRIRQRLMQHIDTLLETLTDDPDTAHLRIIALTRLLDRVIKLESLTRTESNAPIRIEYKYPDGTLHNVPPWHNADYNPTRGAIPKGTDPEDSF